MPVRTLLEESTPTGKAGRTDKWSETMFRALVSRVGNRWRLTPFRGENGGEWCGIVDVLAVRKNAASPDDARLKRGDLFDIILVQMKGRRAVRPSADDVQRIGIVKRQHRAKELVLFEWKRRELSRFSRLVRGEWIPASAEEIFG